MISMIMTYIYHRWVPYGRYHVQGHSTPLLLGFCPQLSWRHLCTQMIWVTAFSAVRLHASNLMLVTMHESFLYCINSSFQNLKKEGRSETGYCILYWANFEGTYHGSLFICSCFGIEDFLFNTNLFYGLLIWNCRTQWWKTILCCFVCIW